MSSKPGASGVVARIPGHWISYAHTISAYAAFAGALFIGVSLHYYKIVQNEHYGYPDEWFPSVSATIGDRYPERSIFQLFIAICSGPRFLLVLMFYCITNRGNAKLPKYIAGAGIFRTLTCGGWTYITSTDDHDWHDVFMISYLVATLPWTIGCIELSRPHSRALLLRKFLAGGFFATLLPLVYFFIQHKVHRVPGAYTVYAFFEWALVLLDVAFDSITALDFCDFELIVREAKVQGRGDRHTLIADRRITDTTASPRTNLSMRPVWAELMDAATDIYIGFVFWTILTSLGLLVWYFPLWHMGISGYEIAVMSTLSPIVLELQPVRRFITGHLYLCFGISGLIGLLSYRLRSPESRLGAISFSVWSNCLTWAAAWSRDSTNAAKMESRISAWSIGLIVSSIAKFAFWTNNPIWPVMNEHNGGWNRTGILLFLFAVTWQGFRKSEDDGVSAVTERPRGSFFPASLGFAGLLFALHSLLSDSSTVISWVWEGFPVRGPLAVPHGAVTLLIMSTGLVFGVRFKSSSRSWTAFFLGSTGAAVLTYCSNWLGYSGAAILMFYLTAVTPSLLSNAARYQPGRTFFWGFLIYNFMVLFHVWVVAYAFVPGGPLVREHTDWVMLATMFFIGCGVFSASENNGTALRRRGLRPPSHPALRRRRACYTYIIIGLQILSIIIALIRFPTHDYYPYHPDSKTITAGIWTIHFSIDNDAWSSERRMEALIREAELDVVGLLESDLQRIIMGNRDTTQYLAEKLGMWVDYGPGPNKHTWGCALLSKFPIINSTHHLLPSPVGELAPAIAATINAYGELIDIYVFHSGQEEDPEDRRLQTEYLANLMGRSDRPAILLSYLVTRPLEGNYNTWVSDVSGMRDIDPSDWDRWCEYILYKGMRRSGYARLSRGTITDTELQVGKFTVGRPENGNERIGEEQVHPDERFPALFRGEGVRGHRYHVFDEPRYFA